MKSQGFPEHDQCWRTWEIELIMHELQSQISSVCQLNFLVFFCTFQAGEKRGEFHHVATWHFFCCFVVRYILCSSSAGRGRWGWRNGTLHTHRSRDPRYTPAGVFHCSFTIVLAGAYSILHAIASHGLSLAFLHSQDHQRDKYARPDKRPQAVQFCWLARLQSCVQEVRSCNAWWNDLYAIFYSCFLLVTSKRRSACKLVISWNVTLIILYSDGT